MAVRTTVRKPRAATRPAPKARAAPREEAGGAGRSLVIVESPAKAKTIHKYLGRGYVVKASMGHVRDLPESEFGFDPDAGFEATYQVIPSKTKIVRELRALAKSAPRVYLATDLDREGEAIAWHLCEALGIPPKKRARVTFNEITERAIKAAFEHPREIDQNKVDAQQARRFLDRMVGYKISPLLWRRAGPGTSAGRVQSVALHLIVDREREIRAFKPEAYWTVEARFAKQGSPPTPPAPAPEEGKPPSPGSGSPREPDKAPGSPPLAPGEFLATLVEVDGARASLAEEGAAGALLARLGGAAFRVASVALDRKEERAAPPFTTSTLQQQAAIRLHFSAKRTMGVAQRLYQGVDLGAEGNVALITYMRTDSVALSDEALRAGREVIGRAFGESFLPERPNRFRSGARAQEAHEAIRPTDPARTPESVSRLLKKDEARLYELIWRRFMACQMRPAVADIATVRVEAGGAVFEAKGRTPVFEGWRRAYPHKGPEAVELPPLAEGEAVEDRGVASVRHETQPPPRYSEASLVKTLEKEGIGRPSTYASIISTLVDRNYVRKEKARFFASALGEVVNDLLVPFFGDIMDVKYTSRMEEELDEIEGARIPWKKVLEEFWRDFSKDLKRAAKEMKPVKSLPAPEGTPPCEKCQRPMVRKVWKGSEFLGCSGYPDCRNTRRTAADGTVLPPPEPTDHVCEKCGKPMVIRTGRRGRFLACTGYPDCKNAKDVAADGSIVEKPKVDEKCDKCGAEMVVKNGRRGPFVACSAFPKCRNAKDLPGAKDADAALAAGKSCPDCGGKMKVRWSRRGRFLGCAAYPKCKGTMPLEAPTKEEDDAVAPGSVPEAD